MLVLLGAAAVGLHAAGGAGPSAAVSAVGEQEFDFVVTNVVMGGQKLGGQPVERTVLIEAVASGGR